LIEDHRERADIVPTLPPVESITEERREAGQFVAEAGQAALLDFIDGAFRDEKSALPIFAALDHDQHSAGFDAAEGARGIVRVTTDAHPKNVHGRSEIDDPETGALAHDGVAAVRADD